MATLFHSTPISCGVVECHGLPHVCGADSDPYWDQFLKDFYWYCKKHRNYSGLYRTLVWSTNPGANADAMCKYMEKWGEVVKTKPIFNHTHNNKIQTFIWTPSMECEEYVLKLVGMHKDPDVDETGSRSGKYWENLVSGDRYAHCCFSEELYKKLHPKETAK